MPITLASLLMVLLTVEMISINCSDVNLALDELVNEFQQALREHNVGHGRLELEITDNALMNNVGKTIVLLKQIRSLGVWLSIDDFGTGYSSLACLKRLPLDTLKIDRSFIVDIPRSPQDIELVHAIVVMAHTLRLNVVIEDVETAEQLELLSQLGSDYVQDYLFGKPQPLATLLPMIKQMNRQEPASLWPASLMLEWRQTQRTKRSRWSD
jgi:EAL domain-containing protein (putative c-di-GMP-specific phosphodiesterase class I)